LEIEVKADMNVEVKEQVKKEKVFKAFADFEFRKKAYKVGDVFAPPSDVYPDPNMDEFRRMNTKKNKSRIGYTFYFETPGLSPDAETQVNRVILPVE
jgi:hypothetical protein